jgi:CubicO group peptidase (beta-lactamase class C family)
VIALLATVTAACSATSTQQAAAPSSTPEPPSWPAPADRALPADQGAALQDTLADWVAGGEVSGATAAVVTADGSWSGAAGVDGTGAALRPDSAMGLASITKTFVAAEVLLLSEQDRVDLDAPLTDYVEVPFDDGGATVRQVLGMLSGFPEMPWDAWAEIVNEDPERHITPADMLALVPPGAPGKGAVGQVQEYNNLNYVLLGPLIEQAGGDPWHEAVRRDLLEPAGLDRIRVQDGERPVPPVAWPVATPDDGDAAFGPDQGGGYLPSRAGASAAGAAGGMAGDAPSVARWAYLLYGGHVLPPSLVAEMTEGEGPDDGYGLGTMRWELDGELTVGHGAIIPGYHGIVTVDPDSATSVAVLVPQSMPMVYDTPHDTVALALHDVVAAP